MLHLFCPQFKPLYRPHDQIDKHPSSKYHQCYVRFTLVTHFMLYLFCPQFKPLYRPYDQIVKEHPTITQLSKHWLLAKAAIEFTDLYGKVPMFQFRPGILSSFNTAVPSLVKID